MIIRLFISNETTSDFMRMHEIFKWLDSKNVLTNSVYRTRVITNEGDYYYNIEQGVEYLYIGLPLPLALLAKLTWGGR